MNDRLRFCPPPQTTLIDAMLILVKFLDDNPGSLKLNLRDVANSVFRQTWPCQ